MRAFLLAALVVVVVGAAACKDEELVCHLDTECLGGNGGFGLCLENRCAFRAAECTGGYRWDDSAGDLAGMCADPGVVSAHDGGVRFDAAVRDAPTP